MVFIVGLLLAWKILIRLFWSNINNLLSKLFHLNTNKNRLEIFKIVFI